MRSSDFNFTGRRHGTRNDPAGRHGWRKRTDGGSGRFDPEGGARQLDGVDSGRKRNGKRNGRPRFITTASARGRPFVVVNCGAIPENLVESDLFGYERGAFTGADRQKKGKFEAADAGTVFLDEIGELSLASQTRLLHVLQDKQIERLGGEGRRIRVDVRVIAATNRSLEQMVAEGTFRQDLFFRLNVLPVRTPSLRERPEDIPLLADHFARKWAAHADRKVSGVSQEALAVFQKHAWPGNIRELTLGDFPLLTFHMAVEICVEKARW